MTSSLIGAAIGAATVTKVWLACTAETARLIAAVRLPQTVSMSSATAVTDHLRRALVGLGEVEPHLIQRDEATIPDE